MFLPVLRVVPSESIHSKMTFPTDDTAQFATVTVQVRVSVSPALVVPGGSMKAERAGTVKSEQGYDMYNMSHSTAKHILVASYNASSLQRWDCCKYNNSRK